MMGDHARRQRERDVSAGGVAGGVRSADGAVSKTVGSNGPVDRAAPLRPLGVAELLDGAVRAVRRNPRVSFAITLPVAVVQTGLVSLTTYAVANDSGLAVVDLLLELFVGSLATVLLGGVLAPLYVEEMLGRRLTASQTLRRVGRSSVPLAALTVVVAFGLEIGVVALAVGGVWLWGVWALAAPALVVERLGPLQALRRAFDLARGGFWRIWGIRALRWVLTTVLGVFVTIPFTGLAALLTDSNPFGAEGINSAGVYVTIAALGSLIGTVLLAPIGAAVDTLLFLDARMRREGMDIMIALAELDAVAAAPASPLPVSMPVSMSKPTHGPAR